MTQRFSDLHCDFEVKSEGANDAKFTGVASTSHLDLHGDVIEAGAFDPIPTKVAPNGDTIPNVLMLRDHERSEIIGGWRSFKQSGNYLHVEGELTLDVAKARETYALMKRGYLSGLSVGFQITDRNGITYDERTNKRTIKKATLRECSIVGFPANTHAGVTAVKTEIDELLAANGFDDVEGIGRLLLGVLLHDAQKRKTESKKDGEQLIKGIDGFLPLDGAGVVDKLRGLLEQVKGRGHG